MKIAIHPSKGSFSDRWIEYCNSNGISFKVVDCFSSDIMAQLEDCQGVLWHWNHSTPEAFLFVRQLVISVEKAGKKIYPNFESSWHYDDKVGQKYLLESIGAPIVPSYVFYHKDDALRWIDSSEFPTVFKLRGGYGSNNVKLVKNKSQAFRLVNRAFGSGFSQMDTGGLIKNRIWKFKQKKSWETFMGIVKGVGRRYIKKDIDRVLGKENGYIYFQQFMPGNHFDTRLIVVGHRCFGIRRYNREGDFRASGSGLIEYAPELFDNRAIKIAFEVAERLNTQSIAFDFIFDLNGEPLIVEISYCFNIEVYDLCHGYWTRNLDWIAGKENIQHLILQDFLISLNN